MRTTVIEFLRRLIVVQDDAIRVLQAKQSLLVKPDAAGLDGIALEEKRVRDELDRMLRSREDILERAGEESLQLLCEKQFPADLECRRLLDAARQRSLRLRNVAATNWTMTQRSIVHLGQLLELIETRGQGKTTYQSGRGKNDGPSTSGGGFVDRVA